MRRHNKNTGIILVIFIIIIIVLCFKIINKKISPYVLVNATDEGKKIANIIINDSVKKQLSEGLTFDKLFITSYENNNNATIDLDTIIVNKFLSNINESILKNLKDIEEGNVDNLSILKDYNQKDLKKGIICKVPLTSSYNNVILTNLAPKVPVRLKLIGNIDSNIRTEVKNYGINNALIEVYADISIQLHVVLPMLSDEITVKSSIPVAIKMFNGNIPEFFSNGNGYISIPSN